MISQSYLAVHWLAAYSFRNSGNPWTLRLVCLGLANWGTANRGKKLFVSHRLVASTVNIFVVFVSKEVQCLWDMLSHRIGRFNFNILSKCKTCIFLGMKMKLLYYKSLLIFYILLALFRPLLLRLHLLGDRLLILKPCGWETVATENRTLGAKQLTDHLQAVDSLIGAKDGLRHLWVLWIYFVDIW